ncbi:MAG: hypothetical protein J1E83_12800 [Lachnospiraceae bacterium]|nr:hypothetical protein [Lachnospiraceae bacterium]
MRMYECHVCHGLCDPGELQNGVCHECRSEAVHREEKRQLGIRKELNQMLSERLRQQADGQLVLHYGK